MIALPVLWLYGASGVGKTTVAWEVFVQLARMGAPTGYVDIDQIGMCYAPPTPRHWAPEPDTDPGRHRLKARTLDAVVANFRDAGARSLVVPGVTDPDRGVDADLAPQAAVTACRLRAGRRSCADDWLPAVARATISRSCSRTPTTSTVPFRPICASTRPA